MDLYFSPLACSMATRIALYEAGQTANFNEVDPRTKKVLKDNSDFYAINALGLVPVLRTDDDVILTENAAILQHVAEKFVDSGIGAKPGMERSRLQQWLCFIGTELHKGFAPLFRPNISDEARAGVVQQLSGRLKLADAALAGKSYLFGDRFCAADVYLFVVSGWSSYAKLDLSPYPSLQAFRARMMERPAVREAMKAEGLLQ